MSQEKVSCPYNEGIGCMPHEMRCNTCGWNPKVAKERLNKVYEEKNIERAQPKKEDTP